MYYDQTLERLAEQFALALRAGKPARMPAIRFSQWPAASVKIHGSCSFNLSFSVSFTFSALSMFLSNRNPQQDG